MGEVETRADQPSLLLATNETPSSVVHKPTETKHDSPSTRMCLWKGAGLVGWSQPSCCDVLLPLLSLKVIPKVQLSIQKATLLIGIFIGAEEGFSKKPKSSGR